MKEKHLLSTDKHIIHNKKDLHLNQSAYTSRMTLQPDRINNYWVQKYTEYVNSTFYSYCTRLHKIFKFENSYVYTDSPI